MWCPYAIQAHTSIFRPRPQSPTLQNPEASELTRLQPLKTALWCGVSGIRLSMSWSIHVVDRWTDRYMDGWINRQIEDRYACTHMSRPKRSFHILPWPASEVQKKPEYEPAPLARETPTVLDGKKLAKQHERLLGFQKGFVFSFGLSCVFRVLSTVNYVCSVSRHWTVVMARIL